MGPGEEAAVCAQLDSRPGKGDKAQTSMTMRRKIAGRRDDGDKEEMEYVSIPAAWKFSEDLHGGGIWSGLGSQGGNLRLSTEWGLSLLYLDGREKCHLQNGNWRHLS